MIKYKIKLELDRLPEYCKECPMFDGGEYQCHNERGCIGGCKMGYMAGDDMRDFSGRWLYSGCKLSTDENVTVRDGESHD